MNQHYEIFPSLFGAYALPENPNIIGYFNENGIIDKEKLEKIAEYVGKYSTGKRELPFWITTENAFRKLRPFHFMPIQPDFDSNSFMMLTEYCWNWGTIVDTYNRHGVKIWFSLFDHDGILGNFLDSWNPWRAFGAKYFYADCAGNAICSYIDAMLNVFEGKDVGYEIVNNPRPPLFNQSFISEIMAYLVENGVKQENIIPGFITEGK